MQKTKTLEKDFLKAAYMPFVYMIIGILTASVAAVAVPELYEDHPMLWTLISALLTIPLCIRQMNKKGYLESENRKRAGSREWILLVVLAISVCIALNDWISLSGLMDRFPGFHETSKRLYGGYLLEEILAIGIAAPIVEELLFRGLVYRGWKKLLGIRTAWVLSAFFFGIYHRNVVQGLYAFLIGLLLVCLYECFETILAPVVFHIVANMISVIMTECLDMSRVQESVGGKLLFAMVFTAIGAGVWKKIAKMRRKNDEAFDNSGALL